MIHVRLSVEEDIPLVASEMRSEDVEEIRASGGHTPEEALRIGYRASEPCFTAELGGRPFAMFGTGPHEDKVGWIWLLGTDDIGTCPVSFLRWSKKMLPYLLQPYAMVWNLVDARNTVHIKWLRWLGFTLIRRVNHGPQQLPFYEFARLTKCADL